MADALLAAAHVRESEGARLAVLLSRAQAVAVEHALAEPSVGAGRQGEADGFVYVESMQE